MTTAPTVRFELYREVDRGAPKAGSNVHMGPDGKPQGMGRREYHPVIERCALVPPKDVDPLATRLVFLPYFRETKPATTLGEFFKAQAAHDPARLRKLLPTSLEGYLRHPVDSRQSLDILVEPQSQSMSVLVAWSGETQWYTDQVFYRLEGIDGWKRGAGTDVVEGSLKDFIRCSPLVQLRLSEGVSQLQHPERAHVSSANNRVLKLSKSPGMPNTRSFTLEVFADGRFERRTTLDGESTGTDVHRLTSLLITASKLAPIPPAPLPRRFMHDAQETSVSYRVKGRTQDVTLDSDTPADVQALIEQIAAAYKLEL
ncbi:hypothetical protein ACN469_16965 [Corallococcus terminator]